MSPYSSDYFFIPLRELSVSGSLEPYSTRFFMLSIVVTLYPDGLGTALSVLEFCRLGELFFLTLLLGDAQLFRQRRGALIFNISNVVSHSLLFATQ